MLPQKLAWNLAETEWAHQINPVLANLLVQGQLLKVNLKSGSNGVNHKLGRTPQGWFLVSPLGPETVYQASYQINPTLTLTLVASGDLTTSVWVF